MPDRIAFQERLGYRFTDEVLLELALTHRSAVHGSGGSESETTNERLEFLGDRVLGLAMADLLFNAYPNESEGSLSRRFAALVCAETLIVIATNLDLLPHIKTGGDLGSTDTIASDACEALIGAIFRDGGFDAARNVIAKHWQPMIDAAVTPPKDAKTELQEWAQGKGLPLPLYKQIDRSGPDHAPRFTISVTIEDHEPATGEGSTKRAAEQHAAESLLMRFK